MSSLSLLTNFTSDYIYCYSLLLHAVFATIQVPVVSWNEPFYSPIGRRTYLVLPAIQSQLLHLATVFKFVTARSLPSAGKEVGSLITTLYVIYTNFLPDRLIFILPTGKVCAFCFRKVENLDAHELRLGVVCVAVKRVLLLVSSYNGGICKCWVETWEIKSVK